MGPAVSRPDDGNNYVFSQIDPQGLQWGRPFRGRMTTTLSSQMTVVSKGFNGAGRFAAG